MKRITLMFLPLVIFFTSCQKEMPVSAPAPHQYELTATVKSLSTDSTLYYRIYVSNDKNAPLNLWLYIGTVQKQQIKSGTFSFQFDAPTVCWLAIQKNETVYGISIETIWGNIQRKEDRNSVTIK